MNEIESCDEWRRLLEEIEKSDERALVYVLGGVDTGKSTLCRFLIDHLAATAKTACIDCDPGQSSIGPPCTLGLRIHARPGQSTDLLLFTGSNSPHGLLLPTATGIKKLCEKAIASGAQRIVVDSSGYVLDLPAREFQFQVIDLLQPDWLVALQIQNELEGLLACFARNERITLVRLNPSQAVTPRDMDRRQEYRSSKFKEYFKDAAPHEIPFAGLGFHGILANADQQRPLRHLLVALCDAENFVVTLGILQEIDAKNKTLRLHCPPFDPTRVALIQLGALYLDPTTYLDSNTPPDM